MEEESNNLIQGQIPGQIGGIVSLSTLKSFYKCF